MRKNTRLASLARKVEVIVREELDRTNISVDYVEARVYNVRSVGVQGDQRTYSYPAEITLISNGKFFWDEDFLGELSTRITNEVRSINRVLYALSPRI